jgi:hypothetical protein
MEKTEKETQLFIKLSLTAIRNVIHLHFSGLFGPRIGVVGFWFVLLLAPSNDREANRRIWSWILLNAVSGLA